MSQIYHTHKDVHALKVHLIPLQQPKLLYY